MITSLAKFALGFLSPGTTLEHARRLVIIALVVIGLLLLGGGGWWACSSYKQSVIDADRLEEKNQTLEDDAAANEAAADARVEDARRAAQEVEALQEVLKDAPDPIAARREFYRCVRMQQRARASGDEPPACGGSGSGAVDSGSSGGGVHDGAAGSE